MHGVTLQDVDVFIRSELGINLFQLLQTENRQQILKLKYIQNLQVSITISEAYKIVKKVFFKTMSTFLPLVDIKEAK
jgi:hypothetical protein